MADMARRRTGPAMTDASAIRYDIASAQALGRRERQEDAVAVSCPIGAEFGFAVVSDGMGGHAAGDLASRIIVAEIFAELILRARAPFEDPADLSALLESSVQTANDSLRAQIEACPDQAGMGGTVVATALVEGGLQWVSVGDSLLYLVRDGRIERLNDDHSMAPQIDLMVERGLIDADAARSHPQRNCLTSALTGQAIPEVDCPEGRLDLREGDLVVLASDGVGVLAQSDLSTILARAATGSSREVAGALIDAVLAAGDPEQDNTSVIVIKVEDAQPRSREVPAPAAPAVAVGEPYGLWSSVAGLFGRPAGGLQAANTARPRS
jgi:serine/threonine protein phosphatase PrpC